MQIATTLAGTPVKSCAGDKATAVVGLAQFIAVFHDACCFTIENDAVFGDGDLVNMLGCFGECHCGIPLLKIFTH
jgi:hypothetical protein